jgi:hypothetical protein
MDEAAACLFHTEARRKSNLTDQEMVAIIQLSEQGREWTEIGRFINCAPITVQSFYDKWKEH